MIRALLDTNIIVDVILERQPFYEDAKAIYEKIERKQVEGYISASAITDLCYLLCKKLNQAVVLTMLQDLVKIIDILPVDKRTIHAALTSGWSDFEDAVQAQVALENGMDAIVTRNEKDYKPAASVRILPPPDFIKYVNSL